MTFGFRKLGFGLAATGMLVPVLVLTGCVSGTTYGTGVSQEEQTIQDLSNMLTLQKPRNNIDYSPRPDLIVPQDKQALVEPIDDAATSSNPQWPETPEERIARVRAEAGEIDARTGDYSVEDQLRKKEGIAIQKASGEKFVPGLTDRDGNVVLYRGDSQARQQVITEKKKYELTTGASRRYLTEPPIEYKIPAETAATGVEAFTEEELAAREEEKKRLRNENLKSLTSRD